MSTYNEILENLTAQICELEALQSVYPKELRIGDHGVLADINEFIKNPSEELPQKLEYSIELSLNNGTIELLVGLSASYPTEKPEVYATSSSLNRTQQLLMNQALSGVVEGQQAGEPCIYTLLSWLQDNGDDYIEVSIANQEKQLTNRSKNEDRRSTIFTRYWIHSHHIYSFTLTGKPGIICIEGAYEDCEFYWQKVKSMNWHKIIIRLLEKEDCQDIDSMRKFSNFQEIAFPSSERHNDLGQLLKYLTDLNLQYAFKELFGLEGKFGEIANS
ncbi:RWD domain-containing protein 2A [Dufourea novaeangliae]|uniref:RWD domain-containing protein 2A n=1 Tax=Dufourea novaeangliae TaxID=178035 RepID=A0A154PAK1_DUFNO|nr:RWD domain-containing protein 2A [Dufourea novaeangliae]